MLDEIRAVSAARHRCAVAQRGKLVTSAKRAMNACAAGMCQAVAPGANVDRVVSMPVQATRSLEFATATIAAAKPARPATPVAAFRAAVDVLTLVVVAAAAA